MGMKGLTGKILLGATLLLAGGGTEAEAQSPEVEDVSVEDEIRAIMSGETDTQSEQVQVEGGQEEPITLETFLEADISVEDEIRAIMNGENQDVLGIGITEDIAPVEAGIISESDSVEIVNDVVAPVEVTEVQETDEPVGEELIVPLFPVEIAVTEAISEAELVEHDAEIVEEDVPLVETAPVQEVVEIVENDHVSIDSTQAQEIDEPVEAAEAVSAVDVPIKTEVEGLIIEEESTFSEIGEPSSVSLSLGNNEEPRLLGRMQRILERENQNDSDFFDSERFEMILNLDISYEFRRGFSTLFRNNNLYNELVYALAYNAGRDNAEQLAAAIVSFLLTNPQFMEQFGERGVDVPRHFFTRVLIREGNLILFMEGSRIFEIDLRSI